MKQTRSLGWFAQVKELHRFLKTGDTAECEFLVAPPLNAFQLDKDVCGLIDGALDCATL